MKFDIKMDFKTEYGAFVTVGYEAENEGASISISEGEDKDSPKAKLFFENKEEIAVLISMLTKLHDALEK